MTPATILVVEDNPITRKMVRVALTVEGYAVIEAPDGKTALEAVAQAAPDLIFQDLLLPDMDGFDLLRQLRALPGGAEVPIIAFSGFLSRLEAARALALGFSDFLTKPVEPSRLVQTVRSYLGAPDRPADQPGQGRHVLVVDDDPIQLKLVRTHLEHVGFRVTTAGTGKQALELARRTPPDVILSDVMMPGMDGFQLCLTARQDPRLTRVPVVLTSSHYLEEPDRQLAERVGASGLTLRTPDCSQVIEALVASAGQALPPPPGESVDLLETERHQRLVRQLERQVAMNLDLVQRVSLQASVLSMLAGLSTLLARPALEAAPAELMASLLDAGGISTGALYLTGSDGRLAFHTQSGHPFWTPRDGEEFFGHPELFRRAVEEGSVLAIPSPEVSQETARAFLFRVGGRSAAILPLVAQEQKIGALLLAAQRRDLTDKDWLAFAQTMASQIAQSIALNRTFAQLAVSERRYRSLFDNLPVGLFRSTPDGQILDANPTLVRLLGFPDRESLLAFNAAELYANPADRQRLQELAEREGVVRGFEVEVRRHDGTTIWARESLQVTREGEGGILYEGALEDITEQRRTEEALRQSEKLGAMGALLAGVAHELNNPLSVVLGQAGLLHLMVETPAARDRLDKLAKAADRCARIVKNFLALARRRPTERQAVQLNQVVEGALELLAYILRVDDVEVRLDLGQDLPVLWADPHQLQQVVVNLVTNAQQAMRGTPAPRWLEVATRFDRVRRRVALEVKDTGPGIPRETQARIFEPFFTTKPPGQGTGLGLSLCQGIVKGHGGTITVQSVPGHGSTFRVELPVETPPAAPPAAPVAPPAPSIARGRILVVDDELEVAQTLADLLAEKGHEVETAAHGGVALEKLSRRRYDLVLSDLRMPELDGPGLYHAVERRHPELKQRFIFLTGDTLSAEAEAFLERTGVPHLAKPFDVDEVHALTQRVLRAG